MFSGICIFSFSLLSITLIINPKKDKGKYLLESIMIRHYQDGMEGLAKLFEDYKDSKIICHMAPDKTHFI